MLESSLITWRILSSLTSTITSSSSSIDLSQITSLTIEAVLSYNWNKVDEAQQAKPSITTGGKAKKQPPTPSPPPPPQWDGIPDPFNWMAKFLPQNLTTLSLKLEHVRKLSWGRDLAWG